MKWIRRKKNGPERVDTDAILNQAQETQRRVVRNQPFVNHFGAYSEARKDSNGFGEDIEFTFRPKRREA